MAKYKVAGYNSMSDYGWSREFDRLGDAVDYYADRNPEWYEIISVYEGENLLFNRRGTEVENEGL